MKKYILFLMAGLLVVTSCSDWLETTPSDQLTPDMAFQSIDDAEVATRGLYRLMWTHGGAAYYGAQMFFYGDVMADDVRTYSPADRTSNTYRHIHTPDNSLGGLWSKPYEALLNANFVLSKLDDLPTRTQQDVIRIEQARGQALALRALFHFDLVRVFGSMPINADPASSLGVPLVTKVVRPDENLSRNTVAQVYTQVVEDLEAAIPLLPSARVTDGTLNTWGAKAILARVHLYQNNYAKALELAEDIIQNGPYQLLPFGQYIDSWAGDFSVESIFELVFSSTASADREGVGYLWAPDGYGAMTLTRSFIDLMTEDPDDVRAGLIKVDSRDANARYLAKYPGKNYSDVRINNPRIVRLSEVYLIAAESALKTGNQAGANAYLKTLYDIRTNRDNDVGQVDLDRIMLERRKELVGEGHRFFDLMRNGLPVVRTGSDHFTTSLELGADHHRALLPIPQFELNANKNMVQNPGYGG